MTKRIIIIGMCGILSVLLVAGAAFAGKKSTDKDTKRLIELSNSLESLSQRVGPAVVQIFAAGYGPPAKHSSTASGLISKQRAVGSGVILDSDGYIVTNAHVVSDARRVQVVLQSPGQGKGSSTSILKPAGERVGAQIIGIDLETDLAVLKVQRKDLPYLELGDSESLRPGEIVLAFGSPLGLQNSVSMGVVSSVARQLRPEDPMIYIQTDATINPGNSGGPLVDTEGNVVGINTLIFSQSGGSEGIGFAAPSNIVKNVFNQLRANGRIQRGHIAVHAQTISAVMAAGLGMDTDWGVILGDVYPGGPAELAGLRIGDIVMSLDGKMMENGRQFDVNLYRRPIGDKVTLEIRRGTEITTARVTVVERKDKRTQFSELVSPDKNLIPKLGILCLDIDDAIRALLPDLRRDFGVVVAARAADAPYLTDGLRPSDIVYTMNRTRIVDVETFREQAAGLKPGDAVVCQVERNGQLMFVTFEIDL